MVSIKRRSVIINTSLSMLTIAGCQTLSQAYAIESQAFVLHATTVITEKGVEKMGTKTGLLMCKS